MQSKLPGTSTTIFSVMSAMAHQYNAINLSQGFPGYSSSGELFDLVHHYMKKGCNQYAAMAGEPSLREAIKEKIRRTYAVDIDPETELCVTAGATQAVFTAIQTIVHPGDEVIVFDPAFDIYEPGIQLSGGKAVRLPLTYPGFRIDWNLVERTVNPKTRAIIINFPHNPTGTAARPEDLKALEQIALRHGLYVISDEVYEHMVFDGRKHESVLSYPDLYSRSFVTFSFGKTFHNTGWKVGYAVAPQPLMEEFRKIHQFVVFSVNRPVQMALADFMTDPAHYLGLPDFYQEKRDTLLRLMRDSAFAMIPTEGTYFQLADYGAVSTLKDTDFVQWLVREHGIAAIPLSPFMASGSGHRLVRFCFAKTNDILEEAAFRLCQI